MRQKNANICSDPLSKRCEEIGKIIEHKYMSQNTRSQAKNMPKHACKQNQI